MLDQQVTLTTTTLLNLIRRRDGEPHTVLASTPTWQSDEAKRSATDRADAELAGYGLAGRDGVDRGLLATVDALIRPQVEYYGWITGGHDGKPVNYTLLAGSAGGEGFVLARNTDHEGVVLVSLRPDQLLENFIAQIPGMAPGRGRPMAVPKSQVARTGGAGAGDEEFAVMRSARPSESSQEADELRRVLSLRRLGGGSLYVAARSRMGTRQRAERPVNYIDTSEGRWLTEEIPGSGEPRVALTPVTPQLVADRLRMAHSRLPI